VIARALLAIPTMVASFGSAQGEPLEIAGVDASAFPTVIVDIVAPVRHSAQRITAAMVDVEGAAVESVSPVDPRDVVVGLVIDDRPEATPAVVTELQGAAVELVRNASDGIEVSLGTPSGLRTALTSDRGANIARIAGITAGAPAVVPLPDVLSETVAELASSPAFDRHAIVVLGGAVEATEAQVAALVEALADSKTALHVLVPEDVRAGALARITAGTGGSTRRAPQTLASMDAVTATIINRFRVTLQVAGGGKHHLQLTVGGERFGADFEIPEAEPAPSATTQRAAPAPSAPAAAAAVATGGGPSVTTTPAAQLDVPPPAKEGRLPIRAIGLGVVGLAVVALVGAGIVFVVRRWQDGGDDADVVIVKKPGVAPVTTTTTTTSTSTPVRDARAKVAPTRPVAPLPRRARAKPSVPPSARRAEVTPLARRHALPAAPAGSPRSSTTGADHDAPSPGAEDLPGDAGGWIVAGDVRLSPTLGEVWCGNRKIELNAPERETLRRLITSEGRGETPDQIIEAGQLDESDGPNAADAMEAQVGPKTGVHGGGNVVRKENGL
jgi:hypothetical protein